jgi:putative lipoprotein
MSNHPVRTISGTVRYLERIALAPNSTLYVSLQDVSLADVAAKVLAQQVIPHAETAGLNFTLTYCAADVLPGHRYEIRAQIKINDALIYTTTQSHPVVLGVDHLQPQEILVNAV